MLKAEISQTEDHHTGWLVDAYPIPVCISGRE